jgi:Domain of unknown function (DUF4062)
MNVRFQVFVSSTQKDLKDERERVINELNRIGYIAVGMEQFPATDEEQFEYIQRIIDDSDYYVVIVKGRYGSEDAEGKSYTEKEFDYAIATKKPALAFLYAAPEKLRLEETDNNPEKMSKLQAFRDKLEAKRVVRYWTNVTELVSSIKDSVNDIARRRPGTGWIRGDQAADPGIYKDVEALRKENADLKAQISKFDEQITFPAYLAHGEDELTFELSITRKRGSPLVDTELDKEVHKTNVDFSWDTIFKLIIPIIYTKPSEATVKRHLEGIFGRRLALPPDQIVEIPVSIVSKIGYQFEALGLIYILSEKASYGHYSVWDVTDKGRRFVAQVRAMRREKPSGLEQNLMEH